MAAVSVFVDDAIRGTLPLVCAKTGGPADLVVRRTRPVGGMSGAIWLLVLLGPVGMLALVVIALFGPATEQLTVRVPYSQAAWDDQRRLRNLSWTTIGTGFGFLLAAVILRDLFPLMWLSVGAVAVATGLLLWAVAASREVDISLDGSRRWVTFSGVHSAFVRAVDDREMAATAGGR